MKFSFHTCGLERLHFEEAMIKLADIGYAACGPIIGPGCHLDPFTITDSQKSSCRRLAEELKIDLCILNPWRIGDFVIGVNRAFLHKGPGPCGGPGCAGSEIPFRLSSLEKENRFA